MDPYHPIRRTLDNIVEPFLAPIRRVVPLIGMFDFSPLVLIILVQVLSSVLISFLNILR
jgi:YggT family protein